MQKLKSKSISNEFTDILTIIESSKERAYIVVNKELIEMYFQIGKYISEKVKEGKWGESIVNEISKYIETIYPNIDGFSPSNLRRMRQFYDLYNDDPICAPLARKLNWTINLIILSQSKTPSERFFYLELSTKNNYSKRDLIRQIKSSLYERTMIAKNSNLNAALITKHPNLNSLKDNYILEFLNLSDDYKEKDLRKAIITNLKSFLLEFSKQFTLVSEEYKLKVGEKEFSIDLLFFNRELDCLVAVELKTECFKPEHLGQLQFYLEVLDKDIKMKDENPSIGLLLCTSKSEAVVEYAMSKSLPPALVATYELKLPDKKRLQNKLEAIVKRK